MDLSQKNIQQKREQGALASLFEQMTCPGALFGEVSVHDTDLPLLIHNLIEIAKKDSPEPRKIHTYKDPTEKDCTRVRFFVYVTAPLPEDPTKEAKKNARVKG